jgi:transcriptional regulator with XRE-family HTH domain
METYRKKIGEQLQKIRTEKNLSKYMVAKRGNTQLNNITAIEKGQTNYTIDSFLAYLKGCNIEVDFKEAETKKENTKSISTLVEDLNNGEELQRHLDYYWGEMLKEK